MLRLVAFCLGALGAAFGVVAIVFHASVHDFSSQGSKPAYLDALSADALTRSKLGVRRTFDIGLFGNSRSIMVGSQELGTSCSFFNYSVPGTTFRTSVALLEVLTAQDRAPELAVISLDNLEIQMMAHPEYLPAAHTARLMVSDLAATFAVSRDYARIVWRYVYMHWTAFKRAFSSDLVLGGAVLAFNPDKAIGRPYRSDGSRRENLNIKPDYHFVPASGFQLIEPLLRRDLERLKLLVDLPGAPERVVIYESPLAPPVAVKLGDNPGAAAAHYRKIIARACRDHNLDCVLHTSVPARQSDDVIWADASHPPASTLGAAIAAMIEHARPCGKAAR